MSRTTRVCTIAVLSSFLLALGACGSTAGGGAYAGGGLQPTMTASAQGSACNPASHKQGCYQEPGGTYVQMVCDTATSQWKQVAACPATQLCQESPDPADTTGFMKVTKCADKPVVATDAGGTQNDSGNTGLDGGGQTGSDAVVGTDTGGSDLVPGPWLSCGKGKCGSQWAACEANAGCKAGAFCVDSCGGKSECEQSCVSIAGAGQSALVVLMTCAAEMECPKGGTGPKCGNGSCETGENPETCPVDCKSGPKCGNGMCETGENPETCPADCKSGPKCGNGTCETGENPETCPADCKSGPKCGNGMCETGENPETCPMDCKSGPKCGDGKCEAGENADTCAADCKSGPKCGDGKCEAGENAATCAPDCGLPNPVCGDGKCEGMENTNNCPKDCGSAPKCGDGKCEGTETSSNCPADCGGGSKTCKGKCGGEGTGGCYCDAGCTKYGDCCPDYAQLCGGSGPVCGDGKCESGETSSNCPGDCGGGTGTSMSACLKSKCSSQYSACMASSGCKGILIFMEVGDCIEVNKCGQDATCRQQKCAAEIQACSSNSGCMALNTCLGKCAAGDQNCQGQCISVGGTQYSNLGQCGQTAGCF